MAVSGIVEQFKAHCRTAQQMANIFDDSDCVDKLVCLRLLI